MNHTLYSYVAVRESSTSDHGLKFFYNQVGIYYTLWWDDVQRTVPDLRKGRTFALKYSSRNGARIQALHPARLQITGMIHESRS